MNFIFYFHDGSHNHGCEAIVRSTVNILNKYNILDTAYIASNNVDSDNKYVADLKQCIFFDALNRFFKNRRFDRYVHLVENRILKKSFSAGIKYHKVLLKCEKNMVAFSIGGDNYSETDAIDFCALDKKIRGLCKKQILWGCSMDSRYLDLKRNRRKIETLKKFDLIVARESLTYDSLKNIGMSNVVIYPDPAFTLPVDETVKSPFKVKDTVGINISPLVEKFAENSSEIIKNYVELVKFILDNTQMDIALIPHVVYPKDNSDYEAARFLLQKCRKSERIYLIQDQNCMQLKAHISRCRFFICARTHASIAAYSTKVPTLVLGYSIKSKGIAKDIFGDYKNYVIPVQNLKNSNQLKEGLKWMIANEAQIKSRLDSKIPDIIEQAWLSGEDIRRVIIDEN